MQVSNTCGLPSVVVFNLSESVQLSTTTIINSENRSTACVTVMGYNAIYSIDIIVNLTSAITISSQKQQHVCECRHLQCYKLAS